MSSAAGVDHPGQSSKARGGGYKQEQGERTVPVRRVAVCGPDGGKIDDWATVQMPAVAGRCKHP